MNEEVNTNIKKLHDLIQARIKRPFVLRTSKMATFIREISFVFYFGGGVAGCGVLGSLVYVALLGYKALGITAMFAAVAALCWGMKYFGMQAKKADKEQWMDITKKIRHIVSHHPEMADDIKPLLPLMHDGSVNRVWCDHVAYTLDHIQTLLKEHSDQQQSLEHLNSLFVRDDERVDVEEENGEHHDNIEDDAPSTHHVTKI